CRLRLGRSASLLGAGLWMSGGYVILRVFTGIVAFINGTAWVPWIWREAELAGPKCGDATARLTLFGALQFLAGAPQLVHITWCGVALWIIGRLVFDAASVRERLWMAGHAVS